MRRILLLVMGAGAVLAVAQGQGSGTSSVANGVAPRAALSQPALSPDGQEIAFAAQGAIWTVGANGGGAHLLIASAETDSRPLYSPDGKWIAFESSRTGNGDIYLYERATGAMRRLTWDDGADNLDSWSPDSAWVYFSSSSHNIGGMNDIYRVRTTGGTPLEVSSERYVSQYDAAAAPDVVGGNGTLAVVSLGEMGLSQWWRNGHAHIDNTEIWRVTPASEAGGKTGYTRLLPTGGAKNLWPMFSRDGKTMYFMSDRSGAENLWAVATGGAEPRALTHFTEGRVLFPTIASDGDAIVFERDFGVWKLDLKKDKVAAVAIELLGAPPAPAPEHDAVTTTRELAVSPDGKKAAFTAHGEVFASGTENGGTAIRVTHTGRMQFDLRWSPDNHDLAYVSDRDGNYHVYQYDFATQQEKQLTHGAGAEFDPVYSPDGKMLVFQRGVTDAVVLNLATGTETVVAHGYLSSLPPNGGGGGEFTWSPDSRYVAYRDSADSAFPNVYIVSANGDAKGEQVTFLANTFGGAVDWSPNGKYLLLQTGQRTEPTRIARVDLVPHLPQFREDEFQKLFENLPAHPRGGRGEAEAATPVKTPDPVLTGIERRASLLPMLNARGPVISPDGKWLAYVSSEGGRGGNIYVMSLEEGAAARPNQSPKQLTTTTTGKSNLQFTADSKEIYYLAGGKIERVAVGGGQPHAVNFNADLTVNFNQEKEEMFAQAWRTLRDTYMNPTLNGVDWNVVHTRYAPEVAAARTPDDLRRVLVEMIGDMNSSHSGIGAPAGERRTPTGHLGLFFDRVKYETAGQLCVTEVVPLGPGALGGARVGDCLETVDGTKIGAGTNLDQVLEDTVGRKLTVMVARGGASAALALQPVGGREGKSLVYDSWVEHNRELVAKLSGGQLGYIHMAAMGQPDLDKLYMDLDSADFGKRGVVVDVRNNNGGFVNAYALDVLTRHPYLTMIPRDFPAGPARVRLGQRALEKPTVLVTNQNSLSDSEDFTEGYEAMHLGKVVGLPTAGWIIFTGGTTLIDGSSLRMPSTRILDHNGKDMELHPRPVDVNVADPLGSWQAGKDPQLAAAVKTLLEQLGPENKGKIAEAGAGRK